MTLPPAAVQGSQLEIGTSTPECRPDQCGNNRSCRLRACQIQAGQEVNVTCSWTGSSTCAAAPVSIHLIDSVGHRSIQGSAAPRVLPGFQGLEHSANECEVVLTFTATTDVVLQCAIIDTRDRPSDRYSLARVLTVKGI